MTERERVLSGDWGIPYAELERLERQVEVSLRLIDVVNLMDALNVAVNDGDLPRGVIRDFNRLRMRLQTAVNQQNRQYP